MPEIITVQIGQYSNFIGSHLWNIQESNFSYSASADGRPKNEVNHDVLFREGKTMQGETTFTPRLVCLDLKGSLGSLRSGGSLYSSGESQSHVSWGSRLEVHKHDKVMKNPFLFELEQAECSALGKPITESEKDICSAEMTPDSNTAPSHSYKMEDVVNVWTDYLRPHFHPKSVLLTREFEYENSTNPFDVFGCGIAEWTNTELGEDVIDSLRFFAEDCDFLQGFHFLFDSFNGFSGAAHKTFEYLLEEYSSKVIHAFPVLPAKFEIETYKSVNARLINLALSFGTSLDHATIFTPLTLSQSYKKSGGRTLPNVNYCDYLHYHTAALLAGALDTITLPYRLKDSSLQITDLAELHGHLGRKLSVLKTQMPLDMLENEYLVEYYARCQEVPWTALCPTVGNGNVFAQNVVLRGVPEPKLKRIEENNRWNVWAHKVWVERGEELRSSTTLHGRRAGLIGAKSVQEASELFLYDKFPQAVNSVSVVERSLKTVRPFPQFFSKEVTASGFLRSQKATEDKEVSSVPMLAALQSGDVCRSTLNLLLQDVQNLKVKRFSRFFELGLEEEEWSDTLEKLSQSKTSYECTFD